MKKQIALALALLVALVVAIPMIARGGVSGGTLDYTQTVSDGGPIDTPSSQWQLVGEVPVVDALGHTFTVRFSGAGFAQDYGSGGVFKGKKYAALKVKVMAGAGNLGTVTFADNRGVIGSESPKPMINAGEWATGAGGDFNVAVYMKSLNQNDLVGFKYWNLTVNYGKEV
jgi:hypothetical protein